MLFGNSNLCHNESQIPLVPEDKSMTSDTIINEGIEDTIVIENAKVKDCYDVITGIERYPEFIGVYSKVEILSNRLLQGENGNEQELIAKYHVHTTFKNITYTLRLRQFCRDSVAQVRYDLVEGPFTRHSGGWDLVQNGPDVKANYRIDLCFSFGVPKMIKKWMLKNILQTSMASIKQRVKEIACH